VEENPRSLAILYWGRRGGGLELFNQLVRDAKHENLHVFYSSRPLINQNSSPARQVSSLNVYRWLNARRSFKSQIVHLNIKTVLIVMASPWDMMLGKNLMKSRVDVVRIIHDGTPHPGEWFPTKFWIKRLTRDCSRIFTLSAFVADQLVRFYSVDRKKITITQFPRPAIDLEKIVERVPQGKKRVLLIGRGKKYQGQELLEKAWGLIPQENIELVIAGKDFKPNPNCPSILYKNYWLSMKEMIDEISTSDLVVFPYIEASQSGTIPICRALGKPVVVTPVGGLMEQVDNRVTGLISAGTSPSSLANTIVDGMNMIWKPKNFDEKSWGNDLIQWCLQDGK
jgi:glycosyltransferase involved in cell wall biosynthesis